MGSHIGMTGHYPVSMRPIFRTIAILAFVLAGTCGSDADPDPSCNDPAPASSVALEDFEFAPACIGAALDATIDLENTGVAPHTFTVEGTDVDVDLPAGASGEASLEGVDAGAYAITCTYHPQMTGTVVVG
jgi:plastocyanin